MIFWLFSLLFLWWWVNHFVSILNKIFTRQSTTFYLYTKQSKKKNEWIYFTFWLYSYSTRNLNEIEEILRKRLYLIEIEQKKNLIETYTFSFYICSSISLQSYNNINSVVYWSFNIKEWRKKKKKKKLNFCFDFRETTKTTEALLELERSNWLAFSCCPFVRSCVKTKNYYVKIILSPFYIYSSVNFFF